MFIYLNIYIIIMNKSKSNIYCRNWLLSQGYKNEDIKEITGTSKHNGMPDFICSDGKKYEAKLLHIRSNVRLYLGRNNRRCYLYFTSNQIKNFIGDENIVVFDKNGNFIFQFLWNNLTALNEFDIEVMDVYSHIFSRFNPLI